MMDCIHARMLVLMLRRDPQSMDEAERSAVRRHVDSCPACLAWEMEERREDAVIAKAMHDVAVPSDLHGRIAAQLKSVPAPRSYGRLAVAAAALFLVVGVSSWQLWPRPVVDVEPNEIASFVDAQMTSSPEAVKAWFEEMGHKMEPPPRFNFEFLSSYDVGTFFGQTKAPRLVFQAGHTRNPVVATVYVLPKSRFRSRQDMPMFAARSQKVQVIDDPEVPDFVYVVIYTGPSLAPLTVQSQ
ncbi:MAG: hypothetical protein K2X38_10845 [Gemmataceae bacterium]|nr:hypothetical protein [Gemmataceae bacterium]